MRCLLPLVPLALVAGCVPAPQQVTLPPPPRPAIRPPVAPLPAPRSTNWQDWPFSPGRWTLKQDGTASVAAFGQSGAEAGFSIRCVFSTGEIDLFRAAVLRENSTGMILIRTANVDKSYAFTSVGNTDAGISARVNANDPQLDAMVFSRGRFLVSMAGVADLVLPNAPEFARVVEDCRRLRSEASPGQTQPSQSDEKIN